MRKVFLIILFSLFVLTGCAPTVKKTIEEIVFYPPLPQEPRLQFLTSITSEEDIGKRQSSFEEFLLGESPPLKTIERPYDFGSAKGKIYVLDRSHKKILIVDLENKVFDYVKSKGVSLGDPGGIWVTGDDYKYVADFKRKIVLVFDNNNEFIKTYGTKGILDRPLDVAVYGEKIFVCDFNLHQIIVFDKESGDVIQRIGEMGVKEGQFFKPTHIIVDKEGNLYVNDAFNFRVQKFDQFGGFIRSIGSHSDSIGGFARPKGIAVDDENHLYVVDLAFENVQIFDADSARVLLFFGGYESGPGGMYLPNPVYIDTANVEYFQKFADEDFRVEYLVLVGNTFGNHRINIYGFGRWIGRELPQLE